MMRQKAQWLIIDVYVCVHVRAHSVMLCDLRVTDRIMKCFFKTGDVYTKIATC